MIKGIHLDLKYLMPRKKYFSSWLRDVAECGINTLLLEYEDKFPFVKYPFLRSEEAFTPGELQAFLNEARGAGLRVIPLVQTLSHLEFALAHEELAHLREDADIPTQINIANPEAVQFVHDLIDEVLLYHGEDEFFHLGADETWFIGAGPAYAEEVREKGVTAVWAKHTRQYVEKVLAHGKRPIVWDDIFWKDPEQVRTCGLPRQTVLASWDYGITDVANSDLLSRVDVYQDAGFDVIGIPCLNWGVLYPRHSHVLNNTRAWAHKTEQSGLMGIINSSWACFHTPLPTQMLYTAATAAMLQDKSTFADDNWQRQFLESRFGVPADGVAEALEELGTNWEYSTDGLGRPITPIVYGMMDMVLHYPGGQKERRKRGAYPLDWNEIDFNKIFKRKLEVLHNAPDKAAIAQKLDELQATYAHAATVLDAFARRANRRQDEARLFAMLAHLKLLYTHLLKFLLHGHGDAAILQEELQSLRTELVPILSLYQEPPSVARLMRMWWEPAYHIFSSTSAATMTGISPFHLAFPVNDLQAARHFYGDVLGCAEGRSSDQWIDFNFFGHQIVAHLAPAAEAQHSSPVGDHDVPIPHFGIVLPMDQWNALAGRLRDAGITFVIEPCIRFQGETGEQATMFFFDPAGNALEFKAFADISQLFAK